MRILLVLAAIVGLSGYAFAQTPPPKSGKVVKQAKPSARMGCKLVGTVKGTKIWAGDCASAPELQSTPTAEPAAPVPPPEANSPADKP
jgi:hypothetical protein